MATPRKVAAIKRKPTSELEAILRRISRLQKAKGPEPIKKSSAA